MHRVAFSPCETPPRSRNFRRCLRLRTEAQFRLAGRFRNSDEEGRARLTPTLALTKVFCAEEIERPEEASDADSTSPHQQET